MGNGEVSVKRYSFSVIRWTSSGDLIYSMHGYRCVQQFDCGNHSPCICISNDHIVHLECIRYLLDNSIFLNNKRKVNQAQWDIASCY